MKVCADYVGNETCEFTIWAPFLENIELQLVSPGNKTLLMNKDEWGYWRAVVEEIPPVAKYFYHLNGVGERPDPTSNYQPLGVHGPSQVVNHMEFKWEDDQWSGIPLENMIIYEIHVGTFTSEGTFEAVIPRLGYLHELGVNAIEIMPVAQFPGERNWGYDGVFPFAVQNSYGGPEGLKKLINACHKRGFSLILDVVYNHLGPEGNYLRDFGPYFTGKYHTMWGESINYDDAYSDGVRNFFIENALYWFRDYHVDALRLDAIHGIYDMSAKPFFTRTCRKGRYIF